MDEKGRKEKNTLFDKLASNDQYRTIIVVCCVIAIALIFLSGFFKSNNNAEAKAASSKPTVTADQYASQMETKLTSIITGIRGVGSAKVMVTMERDMQYVYATEEKTSNQSTEDKSNGSTARNQTNGSSEKKYTIIKDADGSQKALFVTEVQPIVKGVVVVCDGGDNPAVQGDVINAVTTALDISSARVCVIKAK